MTMVFQSLTVAGVYILFALGLSLAFGVGKVLNLAHGAVFTVCGLVIYRITSHESLPLVVLVPVAALAGGVLTMAIDALLFRYIRTHAGSLMRIELNQLVCSLGLAAGLERVP